MSQQLLAPVGFGCSNDLVTDLLHPFSSLLFIKIIRAVGEVQSRHVHTRAAKLLQYLFAVAGRTDCTNDLGLTQSDRFLPIYQ